MRPHKAKTDSDEAMLKRLSEMPEAQQEHFKMVVRIISSCYGPDKTTSGVLLVRNAGQLAVMSINANEMDMAEMLADAKVAIGEAVLEDAPPRAQYN